MLHIGIADFSEPTLLILGDVNSLTWLADQVEAEKDMDFTSMQGVSLQFNFALRFLFTVEHGGLSRQGTSFTWLVTPSERRRLSAQIRGLIESKTPAHAYLEPKPNLAGVQVVASIGEYDPSTVLQS